jgi:hypothetical protein
MPQRCSYRLKTPRSAISPTESASPTTSVRSPFFKGLGLTGVWGNAASLYTVALTLLPAALLSEISSEDTSPTVGNDSVVPDSKRERGECMLAMLFWVLAALAVVGALAIVWGLYLLARRWL